MTGDYITPVLELAHGYSRLKLEKKAVVCFLEAYRRHQAILQEILEVAARSVQSEKLSDATQLCKYLMANPTIGPDIHLAAGRELLGTGSLERAVPHLLRAHVNNPQDTAVTIDYAYAVCRLGNLKLAKMLCEEIFFLCPGDESSALLQKAKKMTEFIEARLGK